MEVPGHNHYFVGSHRAAAHNSSAYSDDPLLRGLFAESATAIAGAWQELWRRWRGLSHERRQELVPGIMSALRQHLRNRELAYSAWQFLLPALPDFPPKPRAEALRLARASRREEVRHGAKNYSANPPPERLPWVAGPLAPSRVTEEEKADVAYTSDVLRRWVEFKLQEFVAKEPPTIAELTRRDRLTQRFSELSQEHKLEIGEPTSKWDLDHLEEEMAAVRDQWNAIRLGDAPGYHQALIDLQAALNGPIGEKLPDSIFYVVLLSGLATKFADLQLAEGGLQTFDPDDFNARTPYRIQTEIVSRVYSVLGRFDEDNEFLRSLSLIQERFHLGDLPAFMLTQPPNEDYELLLLSLEPVVADILNNPDLRQRLFERLREYPDGARLVRAAKSLSSEALLESDIPYYELFIEELTLLVYGTPVSVLSSPGQ